MTGSFSSLYGQKCRANSLKQNCMCKTGHTENGVRLIDFQVHKGSHNTPSVSLHIWKCFALPSIVIKKDNFKLVTSGKNFHPDCPQRRPLSRRTAHKSLMLVIKSQLRNLLLSLCHSQ